MLCSKNVEVRIEFRITLGCIDCCVRIGMIDSLIRPQFKYAFAFAFVCLLLASVSVRAQSGSAQIPEPTGNAVNDFAGIIDSNTKQQLETILINLKRQQAIEFGVVTVKTTGGQEIVDYSVALGRKWGIGPAEGDKQGLLLIIAVDDRKYFTLVSRHLQGELPDGLVGSIQRQYLVPAFKAGDYSKGVLDTARAYIDTLAEKRGFSTASIYPQDSAGQPRSSQPIRSTRNSPPSTASMCCVIIFVLIFIALMSRGRGGSGCLNLLFLGSLFSGGRGGWSSGGWSSGGWSGGGGGSGGGFGGFGGGGDFDGGGAGGSW